MHIDDSDTARRDMAYVRFGQVSGLVSGFYEPVESPSHIFQMQWRDDSVYSHLPLRGQRWSCMVDAHQSSLFTLVRGCVQENPKQVANPIGDGGRGQIGSGWQLEQR